MSAVSARHAVVASAVLASVALIALALERYQHLSLATAISIAGAAVGFGAVSGIVALQRSYFLAHTMPHIVLFTAPLAIIVKHYAGGDYWVYVIVFTIIIALALGFLKSSLESDIVSSLAVATVASLSVLTIYYAMRLVGGVSVYALVVGDPLLAAIDESILAVAVGVVALVGSLAIAREVGLIGADRELAASAGVRVGFYEAAALALVALVCATMVKIVGFLIVAVSLLIPGASSALVSRGARWHVATSTAIALASFSLGLHLSLYTDIPLSAGVGLAMLSLFAIAWVVSRGR